MGPGRSRLSRWGPGRGTRKQRPVRTRGQRKESQGEGAREKKELRPERRKATQKGKVKAEEWVQTDSESRAMCLV